MKKASYIFLAAIAVLFSGCLLKTTSKPLTLYEINYKNNTCVVPNTDKNIYVESVKALDMVDNRQILITADRNFIRYLDDAKYVALPSEMFYKMLVKGVYANCGAKPSFNSALNTQRLKVELISVQILGDKAQISFAYELRDDKKSIKSGYVNKSVYCPDPSSVTIFNTINKASNQAIDELLLEILS
ncbi:ABC-type transport auxiliary lipoprotein family protein [Campylobacter majalis]|uniref:ABC-type transport auxiliary lipoprotein family protein n=1 Tax=Campylobacter majalis TaxID=2790656 RepID=UPI003D68B29E